MYLCIWNEQTRGGKEGDGVEKGEGEKRRENRQDKREVENWETV